MGGYGNAKEKEYTYFDSAVGVFLFRSRDTWIKDVKTKRKSNKYNNHRRDPKYLPALLGPYSLHNPTIKPWKKIIIGNKNFLSKGKNSPLMYD